MIQSEPGILTFLLLDLSRFVLRHHIVVSFDGSQQKPFVCLRLKVIAKQRHVLGRIKEDFSLAVAAFSAVASTLTIHTKGHLALLAPKRSLPRHQIELAENFKVKQSSYQLDNVKSLAEELAPFLVLFLPST